MGEPWVGPASVEEIEADWREFTGGPPVVGVLREYETADVEGIVWQDEEGERSGVVTWWVDRKRAEIVCACGAAREVGPAHALWTPPRKSCVDMA